MPALVVVLYTLAFPKLWLSWVRVFRYFKIWSIKWPLYNSIILHSPFFTIYFEGNTYYINNAIIHRTNSSEPFHFKFYSRFYQSKPTEALKAVERSIHQNAQFCLGNKTCYFSKKLFSKTNVRFTDQVDLSRKFLPHNWLHLCCLSLHLCQANKVHNWYSWGADFLYSIILTKLIQPWFNHWPNKKTHPARNSTIDHCTIESHATRPWHATRPHSLGRIHKIETEIQ